MNPGRARKRVHRDRSDDLCCPVYAQDLEQPVQLRGAVNREDGGQEFQRAAFIRFSVNSGPQQRLAFGVFQPLCG